MTFLQITMISLMIMAGGVAVIGFYFRLRVLGAYRTMINNRVELDNSHIFNRAKLEAEVLPRYPAQRQAILTFVRGIRIVTTFASVLITLVTLFAAILIFFDPK